MYHTWMVWEMGGHFGNPFLSPPLFLRVFSNKMEGLSPNYGCKISWLFNQPPKATPQEIAGLIKGLLTIGFP